VRSALSSPPQPSPVPRDLAQITGLTGSTRPTLRPALQPPAQAACWSLRYHQRQHRVLQAPFCRVDAPDQMPLERFDGGLGDGVAPRKRSWRRQSLADVFAHDGDELDELIARFNPGGFLLCKVKV